MRYKPKFRGYYWRCILGSIYFSTDWWSFNLIIECRLFGLRVCYFDKSQLHHAFETGYVLWGRQSKVAGMFPKELDSWLMRVSRHDV